VKDDMYIPVKCLNSPAPRAVIELTKCGCKSDYSGPDVVVSKTVCLAPPCASATEGYVTTKPEMSMTLRMMMMMIMSDSGIRDW